MKQDLLVFGVAYALGAGTVLFLQSNSACIPVSELPIATFEGELPNPLSRTTIVGLSSPTMNSEGTSEFTGSFYPNPVIGYEADAVSSSFTRDYQGVLVKPSNESPPRALGISVDDEISTISNSTAPSESTPKELEPSGLQVDLP